MHVFTETLHYQGLSFKQLSVVIYSVEHQMLSQPGVDFCLLSL